MAEKKTKTPRRFKLLIAKDKEHKEDVQVFLNGKAFIIQRGVEVEVDEGVVEILRNALSHDEHGEEFLRHSFVATPCEEPLSV